MASIAKFDTWQNAAGVTRSTVLQTLFANTSTEVTPSNSGSGRVYADMCSLTITPLSTSSKLVLLGTVGLGSYISWSSKGAYGIAFDVAGTTYDFSNYGYYDPNKSAYVYGQDLCISQTIAVPSATALTVKLKAYSYNESTGTVQMRYIKGALTVMEIAG